MRRKEDVRRKNGNEHVSILLHSPAFASTNYLQVAMLCFHLYVWLYGVNRYAVNGCINIALV